MALTHLFQGKKLLGRLDMIFCTWIHLMIICHEKNVQKRTCWHKWESFDQWQILIIVFGLLYAVPFPVILALGLRLLKQNIISYTVSVLSCLFQLLALFPMLMYILLKNNSTFPPSSELLHESQAVISVVQGPHKDDENDFTLYWEAMVSIRRLMKTRMTLVIHASIQMVIITALCLIFLIRHRQKLCH